MRKQIQKQCLNCQKEFMADLREHNRGNAKYCSLSCSSKHNADKRHKEKDNNAICAYCDKEFYRQPSHLKSTRSGLLFCTRKCKDLAQRIGGIKEIQPSHYANGHRSDYRKSAFANHPNKCNKCGYNKIIGVLQVHHIDKDRTNNSFNNLELLCPTCHQEFHYLDKSGLYNNLN